MSFDREMVKIMAGNGTKIIHGGNIGNVDPYIEWIKWLSYIPEYEKKRIEYFDSKKISELTSEELRYAKQEITKLSKVSKEQIRTKLNVEQKPEKYEQLSMVDSYILHVISKINFARSLAELDSNIETQLNANDVMRNKSYYYAANPQIKR